MKKTKDKIFKDKLALQLFISFSLRSAVFTVLLIGLFLIAYYVGHRVITWYDPWGPLYLLFKFIENYLKYIFILFWFMGIAVIMFYLWRRTLDYTTHIISSIEGLYDSDSQLVRLPNELKDVEDKLNQIKYNSLRDQQLAKEAEQRKNDLVVYLAHDLKTPLTSVIGYLTLLRDEEKISEELRQKYLSISVEKAERLETLINEFFEITRFN